LGKAISCMLQINLLRFRIDELFRSLYKTAASTALWRMVTPRAAGVQIRFLLILRFVGIRYHSSEKLRWSLTMPRNDTQILICIITAAAGYKNYTCSANHNRSLARLQSNFLHFTHSRIFGSWTPKALRKITWPNQTAIKLPVMNQFHMVPLSNEWFVLCCRRVHLCLWITHSSRL
jgi:hypothetical protein